MTYEVIDKETDVGPGAPPAGSRPQPARPRARGERARRRTGAVLGAAKADVLTLRVLPGGLTPVAPQLASVPDSMAERRHTLRTTASYEAEPGEVGRVLLLYSGGLDTSRDAASGSRTSTRPRWSRSRSTSASRARTSTSSRARRCSSARSTAIVVDAREEFARDYVLPAIKANALYGGGYPLFTALGRPLIAKLAVEKARETRLRHDRPRLHRQGQRPGADRGDRRSRSTRS